uniref:Uncharacterized protein n=1 Tax=Solanum tuberosum TaxID=4113 RepID=M0ZK63_SOLTU
MTSQAFDSRRYEELDCIYLLHIRATNRQRCPKCFWQCRLRQSSVAGFPLQIVRD